MRQEEKEMQPDATLGAALRWMEGEPPMDQVDWEALRSSIGRRAELPLAQRRTRSARLRRVIRPLVPLAAAASVALALWAGDRMGQPGGGAPFAERAAAVESVSAEEVFQANVSEQEFQLMVSGHDNADALLLIALGES